MGNEELESSGLKPNDADSSEQSEMPIEGTAAVRIIDDVKRNTEPKVLPTKESDPSSSEVVENPADYDATVDERQEHEQKTLDDAIEDRDYMRYMALYGITESELSDRPQISYEEYLAAVDDFSEGIGEQRSGLLSTISSSLNNKLSSKKRAIIDPEDMQSAGDSLRELLKPTRRKSVIFGAGIAIFIVVILSSINGNLKSNSSVMGVNTSPEVSLDKVVVEPPFEVAQPADEKPISFDPSVSVASYTDSIDGIKIFVTQQPLTTKQLNAKESELEKISVLLGAEGSIDSDHGKVFIAKPSAQNQDGQTALFIVDQLLLTIRTEGKLISLSSWLEYVNQITL